MTVDLLTLAQENCRKRINNGDTVEISITALYDDDEKPYPTKIAINGHHKFEDCIIFYAADLRRTNEEPITQKLIDASVRAAEALLDNEVKMMWARWVHNPDPTNENPMPYYFEECSGKEKDALPYTIIHFKTKLVGEKK